MGRETVYNCVVRLRALGQKDPIGSPSLARVGEETTSTRKQGVTADGKEKANSKASIKLEVIGRSHDE